MISKLNSILLVLILLLSGNIFAQDFKPAGTKIEEETKVTKEVKENTDQKVESENKACCCTICKDDDEEEEEDLSPNFGTKAESKPLQVQFVFGGGSASPDENHGAGAGIHLGYFVSKNLYIGMTSVAFMDSSYGRDYDDDYDYDDEEIFGQDGAEIDSSVVDPKHIVELRLIPWDFGLYFSGGIMYNGMESYEASFKKQDRTINDNEYKTGLEADIKYEATVLPTFGIGYNHLFDNSLSISIGMNIALAYPQTPEVDVKATDSDTVVTQDDLDYWEESIEKNEKRHGVLFAMGVGFSF